MSFPGGSDDKESACNEETQVRSLVGEDPLEKGMATRFNILAWKIPWAAYSPQGHKESETTERLTFQLKGVGWDGQT